MSLSARAPRRGIPARRDGGGPLTILVPGLISLAMLAAGETDGPSGKVGKRPYEMVWANRTQDDHRPLAEGPSGVDFEKLDGWKAEVQDAHADFTRSREQQLWGKYVGKLLYRGTSRRAQITVRPPSPMPLPDGADCLNLWVYGNNWAWQTDPTTPRVRIGILLRTGAGNEIEIPLGTVQWKEWWLMHARLQPHQLAALERKAAFAGIRIAGAYNQADRTLYFDNLSFYKEALGPLKFPPRPKRGIDMFPGQSEGINSGPGTLPFPTRQQTILPDNLTSEFKTSLRKDGAAYVFEYEGSDGRLEYRYEPKTGTLGDLTVRWGFLAGAKAGTGAGPVLRPMADGGVRFAADSGSVAPQRCELLDCRQDGPPPPQSRRAGTAGTPAQTVVARWRLELDKRSMEVAYTFRLWQKSLVVDVRCLGGQVGQCVIGRVVGAQDPRLVTLPYLVGESARPAVLVMGKPSEPLFLTALMDYYLSNASELSFVNRVDKGGATCNGGSDYLPKTDGKRNDCFERVFLTVSPRFEEVLPNIPNPKSPWMHVAGERLWRAHGAGDREKDYALWARTARYGMTKVVITDHETGWRDGGESFTFRTRAAPGKGGDEGQADYARKIRALGFRYGIYNNYTDFAPVNEFWHEDMVSRLGNGQWRTAWARCYNPKPARAVEYEARLAPIIQEKFKLSTAYCDVHTAVRPWDYVDYDARVPGAGTFGATFYAYGEIMLHQKKTWDGPVYSEGNNHYYYCGLTDGNYGQDQAYRPAENPWLVDFDLRKMHPLCCNFGMGNLGMFYGREDLGATPAEQERKLDRFLAATVAFGHTGFLVQAGGIRNTVRSYFLLQQLHAGYAQATAAEILYADEAGRLLPTSAAVAAGAYKRSQIKTTYSNGLEVWVNGHPRDDWRTPNALLPPNGFWARSKDGKLLANSSMKDGRRVDYVQSPEYVYCDGRGQLARFDHQEAAADGALIVWRRQDGTVEAIPVECKEFAVGLDGRDATAVAVAEDRKQLGPAQTRLARGMVHVMPVKGAFSYLLRPGEKPAVTLQCPQACAIPGQTLTIRGREEHEFRVPATAKPGTVLWAHFEGAWLDFAVRPLADARGTIQDGNLRLRLHSNLAADVEASATLLGQERKLKLLAGAETIVDFPLPPTPEETVLPVELRLRADGLALERTWWLKAERGTCPVADLPAQFEAGQCYRKGKEEPLDGKSATVVHPQSQMSCGGQAKSGIFMHPPWKGGVGYAYALFPPIRLPRDIPAVLRCSVGKGDGSDVGDGILFQLAIVDSHGKQTVLAERQWAKHAWTALEGDLSPWAGQEVRVKLITDVGPADNSSGDWACWADLRIESKAPMMSRTLHDLPVKLRYEPPGNPVSGLRVEDLRKARRGWLCFEGQGVENSPPYVSQVQINHLPVGPLPHSAGADETQNRWSPAVRLELPRAVIESLQADNRLVIHNPGGDCFKIRRIRIDLELADGPTVSPRHRGPSGRKCSSRIETTVYSQPPGWEFAEGVGIEAGEPITTQIPFDLAP